MERRRYRDLVELCHARYFVMVGLRGVGVGSFGVGDVMREVGELEVDRLPIEVGGELGSMTRSTLLLSLTEEIDRNWNKEDQEDEEEDEVPGEDVSFGRGRDGR